ncbi:hypothetical protein OQA88_8133 [Cercophora sp. LCS_1]
MESWQPPGPPGDDQEQNRTYVAGRTLQRQADASCWGPPFTIPTNPAPVSFTETDVDGRPIFPAFWPHNPFSCDLQGGSMLLDDTDAQATFPTFSAEPETDHLAFPTQQGMFEQYMPADPGGGHLQLLESGYGLGYTSRDVSTGSGSNRWTSFSRSSSGHSRWTATTSPLSSQDDYRESIPKIDEKKPELLPGIQETPQQGFTNGLEHCTSIGPEDAQGLIICKLVDSTTGVVREKDRKRKQKSNASIRATGRPPSPPTRQSRGAASKRRSK